MLPSPAHAFSLITDLDPIRSSAILRLNQMSDSGATATTGMALFNPDSAEAGCWVLPAERWVLRFGRYVYNDNVLAYSPVKRAKWTHGRLFVIFSSRNLARPLNYPLVRGTLDHVALLLRNQTPLGEVVECYDFSVTNASIIVNRPGPDAIFRATAVSTPALCPTPPSGCAF